MTARSDDAPAIVVVMITLNEAHHLPGLFENLRDFPCEVFIVDSFSSDETVDIALRHGAHVVQRRFRGFGDQWNFALRELPVTAPWTMKLDPDERLSPELKREICAAVNRNDAEGHLVTRRLWFMGRPLPIRHRLLRLWRTGAARFSDVLVNEHPLVDGRIGTLRGDLEHHDSPDLHHWYEKQNTYTTMEALSAWRGDRLSERPRLFGSALQRQMWLKRASRDVPLLPFLLFLYYVLAAGTWRAGWRGILWANLRRDVYRMIRYKRRELDARGAEYRLPPRSAGEPDARVTQCD